MRKYLQSLKKQVVKKPKKMFIHFVAVLTICISFAVSAVGTLTYFNSAASLKAEVGLSNLGQLKQAGTVIDLVLSEVSRTAGLFANDAQINHYSSFPSAYELGSIASRIGVINHSNRVVHSIYIYFENTNRVVSSINSETYHLSEFYDRAWLDGYEKLRYTYTMPVRHWEKSVGDAKVTANVISYLRSIPLAGDKKGAIVINVDEEALTEMIAENLVRSTEKFMVVNGEGMIILSSDKALLYKNIESYPNLARTLNQKEGYFAENLDGRNMLVSFTSNDRSDWRFISFVPTEVVYERIRQTQTMIIFTCFILILAGGIASLIISSRLYKPISRLVDSLRASLKLGSGSDAVDEVKLIGSMFSELFGEKSWLEQRFTDSIPVLREKFLKTLVGSNVIEQGEYLEKLRSLSVPFSLTHFQVIVFEISKSDRKRKIRTMEGMALINSYIRELIEKELAVRFRVMVEEIDLHNMGVIVNFENAPREQETAGLMELCAGTVEKSRKYMNIRLFAGMGKAVDSFRELSVSYGSAMEALKYKQISEVNRVIYINDVEAAAFGRADLIYDKEKLLVRYIKACDPDNSGLTVQRIIDALKSQKIAFELVHAVFIRLFGTVENTVKETGVNWERLLEKSEVPVNLTEYETVDEMGAGLAAVCDGAIRQMLAKRQGKNWEPVEKAKKYMEEHLAQDMSVDDAAAAAGLSSSHFSRIFKEETGCTVVEYLTGRRMEKARILLETTDLKVSEVSERVGYNKQTYFITTFKNCFGMTPKNYKEIHMWKYR